MGIILRLAWFALTRLVLFSNTAAKGRGAIRAGRRFSCTRLCIAARKFCAHMPLEWSCIAFCHQQGKFYFFDRYSISRVIIHMSFLIEFLFIMKMCMDIGHTMQTSRWCCPYNLIINYSLDFPFLHDVHILCMCVGIHSTWYRVRACTVSVWGRCLWHGARFDYLLCWIRQNDIGRIWCQNSISLQSHVSIVVLCSQIRCTIESKLTRRQPIKLTIVEQCGIQVRHFIHFIQAHVCIIKCNGNFELTMEEGVQIKSVQSQ